jgi:hypothetical protein
MRADNSLTFSVCFSTTPTQFPLDKREPRKYRQTHGKNQGRVALHFMKKLIKILLPVVVVVVGFWLISGLWLDLSYASRLPKVPDATSGHVHQVIVNHSTRYASDKEVRALAMHADLAPFVMISFALVVLFAFILNIVPLRSGRSQ